MMKRQVQINKTYRHFKGSLYKVVCLAKDCETLKEVVVYKNTISDKTWVRDCEDFLSLVDKEKYPYVKDEFRFTLID